MSSSAPAGERRTPFLHRLLFSLALLAMLAALLEAVLRLTVSNVPPFEEVASKTPGTRAYNFTLNIRNAPVIMPKPAGVYRVMVFGESATDGWHIRGFPTWMNGLVQETHPAHPVEVLNFGVVGTNSTRIREWYFPALALDPDLIILYIGNNEMVEYTSLNPTEHPWLFAAAEFVKQRSYIYHVLGTSYNGLMDSGGMAVVYELLNKALHGEGTLTPEPRRRAAERLYHDNLADMIKAARDRGIKVVVLSPACNLKDWPPLKSAHYGALTAEHERQFDADLASAHADLESGNSAATRAQLAAALALDPYYAEADYLYGRSLLDGGSVERARKYLELAQQYDDFPLRPPHSFVGITRRAAAEGGAEFVDMDKLLRPATTDGIIGSGLIYDYVHFTPRGNYEAARLLLAKLGRRGLIPEGRDPVGSYADEMARFPLDEQYAIDLHSAEVLGFAFDNRELIERSIKAFGRVVARHPENTFAWLAQAALWCRLGRPDQAIAPLNNVYGKSPRDARLATAISFGGILEIYQGQVVVAGGKNTIWYIIPARFSRWQKSRDKLGKMPEIKLADFGGIPLQKMTAAFVWDSREHGFRDLSAELASLKAEATSLNSRAGEVREDLLAEGPHLLHPVGMAPDFKHNVFRAETSDSYLVVSPLAADPLIAGDLRIKLRLTGASASPNWMVVYWASERDPAFQEDHKITFSCPIDGRVHELYVPIGRILPLILDRPITSLRLDFTASPATIELRRLELRRDP